MFEKIAAYLAKQMDISVDDIHKDTTFEIGRASCRERV